MEIMESKGKDLYKPSGLITISNKLTKNEHKLYDGILKMTHENLEVNPDGRIKTSYGTIMKLTGLTHTEYVKKAMRGLMTNQIVFKDYLLKNGQEHFGGLEANFLAYWKWWDNEDLIEFQIPDVILPILKDNSIYAKLDMRVISSLQNKHALWMYEVLVDYKGIGKITYEIDTLRELAGLGEKQYTQTKDLMKWVINKAVDEVNAKTSLKVNIETNKRGRKIHSITFNIHDTTSEKMKSEKLFREYVVDLFNKRNENHIMSINKVASGEGGTFNMGFKENASGKVLMYDMDKNRPLPKEQAQEIYKRLYEVREGKFWDYLKAQAQEGNIRLLAPSLKIELENFINREEIGDLF